jgi:hypothetical protein
VALLVRAHTPADRCFLVSWAAQLKRLCMDGGTNTFAPDEPKHTHSPIMVRWLCALFVAGAILSFYALLSQTTVVCCQYWENYLRSNHPMPLMPTSAYSNH